MRSDVITAGLVSSYSCMPGKQGKVILEGPRKALLGTGIVVRIAWRRVENVESDTWWRGELSKESFMLVGESGRGLGLIGWLST